MEASSQITEALLVLGPWFVFLMAFAETAFVVGLILPTEPTIIAAILLAMEGHLAFSGVITATVAGGALGDSCGFWLGRKGGRRLLRGEGRLAEIARSQQRRASRLTRRYSLMAIPVGRLISFVRTLMPLMSGMSDLPYRRFLAYDLLGVALWAAASILLGLGAGLGWQRIRDDLGPEWAVGALAAALAVWALLMVGRLRRRRRAARVDDS